MILEIISIKDIFKKLLVFALIVLSFSYYLIIYNDNQEEIKHYKPYYAESYLFAAEHRFSIINGANTASAEIISSQAKSVPVLVYHGIVEKPDGVSTSIEDFKDQMFRMKQQGYQTVRVDDFYQYVQGKKNLPDKSFLLTFDDGRKDSYYPVDPILAELHYSAVMFVITGTLNSHTNNFHLIKSELAKMANSGRWDLEAHTANGHGTIDIDAKGTKGHFYSNKMWLKDNQRLETDDEYRQRISSDMSQAKDELKKDFNVNALAFAYPYGDYGQGAIDFSASTPILKGEAAKIFPLTFYQTEEQKGYSFNLYGSKNQMIKRINIESDWNGEDLMRTINNGREKDLPLDFNTFNQNQGWIKTWGSIKFVTNKLVLSGNDEAKGASVFLDGTDSLRNYQLSGNFNAGSKTDVFLLLRYKNDSNFISVGKFNDKIEIINRINGIDTILATKPASSSDGSTTLMVRATNGTISAWVDGSTVQAEVGSGFYSGGIGLMIFNEQNNDDEATINSVHVNAINN